MEHQAREENVTVDEFGPLRICCSASRRASRIVIALPVPTSRRFRNRGTDLCRKAEFRLPIEVETDFTLLMNIRMCISPGLRQQRRLSPPRNLPARHRTFELRSARP